MLLLLLLVTLGSSIRLRWQICPFTLGGHSNVWRDRLVTSQQPISHDLGS